MHGPSVSFGRGHGTQQTRTGLRGLASLGRGLIGWGADNAAGTLSFGEHLVGHALNAATLGTGNDARPIVRLDLTSTAHLLGGVAWNTRILRKFIEGWPSVDDLLVALEHS